MSIPIPISAAPATSMSAAQNTTPPASEWGTFIQAYAAGRWNPHRMPNRPISSFMHVSDEPSYTDQDSEPNGLLQSQPQSQSQSAASASARSSTLNRTIPPSPAPSQPNPLHRVRNSISTTTSLSSSEKSASTSKPNLYIPIVASSASTINPFTPAAMHSQPTTPGATSAQKQYARMSLQHAAATLRIAGTHINIAPLALPSPEHELTDPMRGVNTTIPGLHPSDNQTYFPDPPDSRRGSSSAGSPREDPDVAHTQTASEDSYDSLTSTEQKRRSNRREGLKQFWSGTQDVEPNYSGMTPPPDLDRDSGSLRVSSSPSKRSPLHLQSSPESETDGNSATYFEAGDYFSHKGSSRAPRPSGGTTYSFLEASTGYRAPPRTIFTGPMSVPVASSQSQSLADDLNRKTHEKRMSMTRQVSAPLPVSLSQHEGVPSLSSLSLNNVTSELHASAMSPLSSAESHTPLPATTPGQPLMTPAVSFKSVPSVVSSVVGMREELLYHQFEYLHPPLPPDENERRKALYK
jgi:hypothetical protein